MLISDFAGTQIFLGSWDALGLFTWKSQALHQNGRGVEVWREGLAPYSLLNLLLQQVKETQTHSKNCGGSSCSSCILCLTNQSDISMLMLTQRGSGAPASQCLAQDSMLSGPIVPGSLPAAEEQRGDPALEHHQDPQRRHGVNSHTCLYLSYSPADRPCKFSSLNFNYPIYKMGMGTIATLYRSKEGFRRSA